MKNKNLLIVLGIMIALTFLLTWIVPSSTIGTSAITLGAITPTGIADIFSTLEIILVYFAKPAIMILFIGMFYGVINKTGSYKALVDNITSIFKKNELLFVILTVLFYGVTTGLTGIYLPMFIFVPLSVAVLLELKYKKLQAILASIGAITVGLMAQLSSATIKSIVGVTTNSFVWIKFGLLLLSLALVVFYIYWTVKNTKEKKSTEEVNKESMFVPEKRTAVKTNKTKGIALLVVLSLMFIVFVLGLTVWSDSSAFTKFYTKIQDVKIGSFAIFASILGDFETFGSWTLNSIFVTISLATVVMAIVDRLKFGEMIEASVNGAKKVMNLAVISALICLVVIFTLNSGFMATIINGLSKGGNVALITLSSLIASPFMVEQVYSAQYVIQILSITASKDLAELYGLIVQITYGFTMLIAPTSVLLLIGLAYVEEGYTKWFKFVWKLLVGLFVLCLIAITIAALI